MPTAIKPVIREFEGIYREQMPLLAKACLKPATLADIIELRLKHRRLTTLADILRLEPRISFDRHYNTSTGIAYAGDDEDRFKVIPYSEELVRINPETELYLGGIKLSLEQYQAIEAQEFTRKDAFFNQRLTEAQVLEHPAWLAAVNENKELLNRYASEVFKLVQDKFKEKEAMGFYIRNPQSVPNLRALCPLGLNYRFDINYDYDLSDYAYLIGVHNTESSTRKYLDIILQILYLTRLYTQPTKGD